MEGRWTIRWQPWVGGTPGGYKVGGREPWPTEDPTPVVPCDDAAMKRVAVELRSMLGDVPLNFHELAEMALRAAGGQDAS